MIYLLKNPSNRNKFIIFIGDIFLIAVTLSLTILLCSLFKEQFGFKLLQRPLKPYALYLSVIIYLIMLYIFEMYEVRKRYEKTYIFALLSTVSIITFFIMFSLAKVMRINQTTMVHIAIFFILSIFLLYFWRVIFTKILRHSEYFNKRVLFIGTDTLTQAIINESKDTDYKIQGFIADSANVSKDKCELNILGNFNDLENIINSHKIQVLVTACSTCLSADIIKEVYGYKSRGIQAYDSTHFYEILTRKVSIRHYLEENKFPYFNLDVFENSVFKKAKRAFDIIIAGVLLIVLFPLFLVVAISVKLTSQGPIFYFQERLGFQEKPFKLIKFRTMVEGAEDKNGPQWATKKDVRVTKIGKFLRKTRLDELPQFINILKGELSFVGPRPIRRYFADILEKEVPFYPLRFSIKPGLTGWAQVHYDYGENIEGQIEKFQYDLYYLKHASLFLDLFIMLKTLQTLVCRSAQ